jgi:hypothetical protein
MLKILNNSPLLSNPHDNYSKEEILPHPQDHSDLEVAC